MSSAAAAILLFASALCAQPRADGLYAEIRTSKGLIVARLEADLTPLTVTNFVGLAEGTIANAAFDPGRPFYDGSVYHRVVPGHVIQTGIPNSTRARNPGYQFPNELNARLSHNHAGALNMANGGPNTNGAQFCITLGDRSYLDGDFTVFGEVVQGMDVVMRIVQGDVVQSVRIARVGVQAQGFHPTTESFQALREEALRRVAEHADKKRTAEREWLARNYPLAEIGAAGAGAGAGPRIRYRAHQVRYRGNVAGREGPVMEVTEFGSDQARLDPALDRIVAEMKPGERRVVAVPPEVGYGRAGFYGPNIPGKARFVISPGALVVYEIEALRE
jgi:peptidylprolyl isomerase